MAKYFGTDGIRGRFGIELNAPLAFKVAQSLKRVLNVDKSMYCVRMLFTPTVSVGKAALQVPPPALNSKSKGSEIVDVVSLFFHQV